VCVCVHACMLECVCMFLVQMIFFLFCCWLTQFPTTDNAKYWITSADYSSPKHITVVCKYTSDIQLWGWAWQYCTLLFLSFFLKTNKSIDKLFVCVARNVRRQRFANLEVLLLDDNKLADISVFAALAGLPKWVYQVLHQMFPCMCACARSCVLDNKALAEHILMQFQTFEA